MPAEFVMLPPQTERTREWGARLAAALPELKVVVAENHTHAAQVIGHADSAFGPGEAAVEAVVAIVAQQEDMVRRYRGCREVIRRSPVDLVDALLQRAHPIIQPIAIAIERVDRGRQPPAFVLSLPCDRMKLLFLPRQIGGRGLVATEAD